MRVTMPAESQASTSTWKLWVSLRLKTDGPEVAWEPVSDEDLADARSEAWLAGCLRKGDLSQALDEVPCRLVPIPAQDSTSCTGFAIEVTRPGGECFRQEFPVKSLQSVASRAAQRLVAAGDLQPSGLYYFKLQAEPHSPGRAATPLPPVPFAMETRSRALTALKVPLAPLLVRAEPVGDVRSEDLPVFYTEPAFVQAERCSRMGSTKQPPVETGAVLVGTLCSCPRSGELFVVVCDALEARDAEQTPFSLFYSSQSWARIQAIMRARQAQPTTHSQRILGQAHGHNFLPSNQPPCESCPKQKTCQRTSVFVSSDDHSWSRAVFHQQPWQLCHIFGSSARGEPAHSLFGLSQGFLVERGFHVIPDFDTAAWPLVTDESEP
jgi:hypothetical protein